VQQPGQQQQERRTGGCRGLGSASCPSSNQVGCVVGLNGSQVLVDPGRCPGGGGGGGVPACCALTANPLPAKNLRSGYARGEGGLLAECIGLFGLVGLILHPSLVCRHGHVGS
jgi:hypothetical protein